MAYLANWNVFQWTDKRYGHLQVEEKVSATKRKKDLFKFELLVTVNHIFIKWRAKSLCVMLQNNSSYIEMFWIKSQITCSKIWKTRQRILLEHVARAEIRGTRQGVPWVSTDRQLTQAQAGTWAVGVGLPRREGQGVPRRWSSERPADEKSWTWKSAACP